ncbi:hypothetical protein RND81_08G056800 [Saponaria officinalis]|uniref:FRIGIDA-like protein n=1 Tax=Saponaria officinalis TaxID=3572 RepID=A0AAW1J2V9_SAPOF
MTTTTKTTSTTEIPQKIESFFSNLEEQKTLFTNYTDSYKTLIDHFTNLQNSLQLKSQTLDSKFQTLDSSFNQSLDSLQRREDSIPNLLDSLSSTIESRKNVALIEASKAIPEESAPLSEKLRWVCGRMDPCLLVKFLLVKRREASTLRLKMTEALSECVDAERFVVDAVRDFVEMKREKRVGMTDFRWACSMAVGSMFPPENLKEGKVGSAGLSRVFAKKVVERAEAVLREWKKVADNEAVECGGGGQGCGMWHSEAAMFIEVVLGFGLKEMFEEEFYKKLIVQFCGRRVMAKLAIPLFGDKIADLIEEFVKDGKEVEAIYFAFEAGLTDRFQPVSLLKTSLQKSKKKSADILGKGHNSPAATDEADSVEMMTIKSIIKCVEDHNIEEQFPVETLRKRLAVLEKAKADKKGMTVRYSKRTGGVRPSAQPPFRPAKIQKHSKPYPTFTRPKRDRVSTAQLHPVPAYPYPSQSTYGVGASTYAPSYGVSHIPAPALPAPTGQMTQQHYGIPGESVPSSGATLTSSYGSDLSYVSYDYGANVAPAYQPPSYTQ